MLPVALIVTCLESVLEPRNEVYDKLHFAAGHQLLPCSLLMHTFVAAAAVEQVRLDLESCMDEAVMVILVCVL